MRVSAIHDRRFPAVNSCTKCNSRAEDAIHRGCKKTQFFTAPFVITFLSAHSDRAAIGTVIRKHQRRDIRRQPFFALSARSTSAYFRY